MTVFSLMTHAFAVLTPDYVLSAVESLGLLSDGRLLALNSYENRVYQVGIDDEKPLIAKFYRPERWTNEQILEEHAFLQELYENGVAAVPAMVINGKTLHEDAQGMRFTLFERKGGHAPELDNPDHLYSLGQSLGRIHRIGRSKNFIHRPRLDIQQYGYDNVAYILENMIPDGLRSAYESLCKDVLALLEQQWQGMDNIDFIRCHADFHQGNILWRDDAPHFVDFDDTRMAPAIQDIWMLLSGDRMQQTIQLQDVLEGYALFDDFNPAELRLIEPLRTLRIIHHAAWLARRWDDPAFPMHFPWFNTERYWGEHILHLREQFFALQQPPLQIAGNA